MTSRTTILLPLHNDGATLPLLLSGLVEYTPADLYDVVIADRGSTDATVGLLEQLAGDVTIVRLGAEHTLGAAINAGLDEVITETVVLVSPATRFHPHWLEPLLAAAEAHPTSLIVPNESTRGELDVLVFAKVLANSAPFNESLVDDQVLPHFVARVHDNGGSVTEPRAATRAAETPVAPSQEAIEASAPLTAPMHIEDDLIGTSTGIALREVLDAGLRGAQIGELPEAAAELLRERLWAEEEYRLLQQVRAGRDVCWLDEGDPDPLVTVRIATYNKPDELIDVAIPSVLRQTHENLELIVVGDHTDERTAKAMASITDERVRFVNLPRPSLYPEDPVNKWRVGGSAPMNLGVELARGSWIAPCDDDDELTDTHIEVLLKAAIERRLEFVWSKTLMETPNGWQIVGREPLATGNLTIGSVLWSAGLRFMNMSTTCWKFNEPHDGNLFRRMQQIGVKMGFVDEVVYKYYLSTLFKVAAGAAR